jgi:hypothetical protein
VTAASPPRLDRNVRGALPAAQRLALGDHERPPATQRLPLSRAQFDLLQQAIFGNGQPKRWADDKLHWTKDAVTCEFTLPGIPGLSYEKYCTELRARLEEKLHALLYPT